MYYAFFIYVHGKYPLTPKAFIRLVFVFIKVISLKHSSYRVALWPKGYKHTYIYISFLYVNSTIFRFRSGGRWYKYIYSYIYWLLWELIDSLIAAVVGIFLFDYFVFRHEAKLYLHNVCDMYEVWIGVCYLLNIYETKKLNNKPKVCIYKNVICICFEYYG